MTHFIFTILIVLYSIERSGNLNSEKTNEKKWSVNKSVILPLIISLILPLLSILLPIYNTVDGFTYKLGLPVKFFYFYGSNLPSGFDMFSRDVLSKQVSFQTFLYTLNVMICYFVIYLIRLGVARAKEK